MVHKSAVVGAGSVLGPRVVIGPDCEVGEGVRLEGTALLRGTRVQVARAPHAEMGTVRAMFVLCLCLFVQAHSIIKDSVIGWGSHIGKWCSVVESVFGEAVRVLLLLS